MRSSADPECWHRDISAAAGREPASDAKALRHYSALTACLLTWAAASPAIEASAATPTAGVVAPAAAPTVTGAAIRQELRSFGQTGTVLHVGAHPDDENTHLITYFARGRGYRMGYLSVTRGDGGQNELGSDFDEKLGVARTQELLAARELDQGRQFFTRAIDFGFSKSPEETLAFWDRQQVLGDVVRIIRQFRPDVIVTRFPIPPGSGGHGHHTASAMLALEAFNLAGNAAAYPEQIKEGLTPWQAKRIVWNGNPFSRGGGLENNPSVKVDIGGDDPVTGESFASIASRSRGMHKTQGFGRNNRPVDGGPKVETFLLLGGTPAKNDLMDGVDTTWARIPGGAEIGGLIDAAITQFKSAEPSASVAALLRIRTKLAALPSDPLVDDKRAQLDRILQHCLGLTVATRTEQSEVVAGERLKMRFTIQQNSPVEVRWLETRHLHPRGVAKGGQTVRAGEPLKGELSFPVPTETPLTQPYWLREDGDAGLYHVAEPQWIGRPENPPAFPLEFIFEVGGQRLTLTDEPTYVADDVQGEPSRKVAVIPPVSLRLGSEVSLFAPGTTRTVSVEVSAARPRTTGHVRLATPPDWQVRPATQSFQLAEAGAKTRVDFTVTSPARAASGWVTASASVEGVNYSNQRIELRYAHLPRQLLQPEAKARLVSFALETRGQTVGYLPGAGDSVAEMLQQMGYQVKLLEGADLTAEKLRAFDAVVIGVRAFNERQDLAANLPGLFSYVENGGTVVAQYNRPTGLSTERLGPYPLSIAGDAPALRITDEKAPVVFLDPQHAALSKPNRLGPQDFEGWVQERGAYFPSKWDETRYAALLAINDPGTPPLKSGILVARHGRGYFVYTGLAFFRQLPAGVPGAYRLFANLVSLGKE